ncbi:hypothetical protein cyc_01816 [Cyclospora cayetanensis]|uniref:Uncharacterized protein n=1 Tax=Cyclospora cayetanensis TaxID=88456 RepID=A0A1D3CSL5_9EIME|nr:hypothetical protein cyc_01816 [Cyclospora cayetanensis]
MESSLAGGAEPSNRTLQQLQEKDIQQRMFDPTMARMYSTKFPPSVSPPPELSDLNSRFVRQFVCPGTGVKLAAQPQGMGPWCTAPVFQHTFQSSKPNVRITITPRHGRSVEYIVAPSQ